jgi:uncharacterized protein (TIGR02266 family)
MSYNSMLEAFEALNQRRHDQPEALSDLERTSLKHLRNEIEEALFQRPTDASADRRTHLRTPVNLEVRFWTSDEMRDRYISVLGEGGLFISTDAPLPEGTPLELEVALERRGFRFRVRGVVANVVRPGTQTRSGMGVRFVGLDYEQKALVYQLVRDVVRARLLERRQSPRLAARLALGVRSPAGGAWELMSEDLSAQGVLAVGGAQLASLTCDTPYRLSLPLPGLRRPLSLLGRLARTAPGPGPDQESLAFQFVDVPPDATKALLRFMAIQTLGLKGMTTDAEGRRLHPRLKRRIPVQFRSLGLDRARLTFSRDISRSGVFLQSLDPLTPGERLEVVFESPGGQPSLNLACEVVRRVLPDPSVPQRVPGIGATFVGLKPEAQEQLRAYLKSLLVAPDREPSGSAGSGG